MSHFHCPVATLLNCYAVECDAEILTGSSLTEISTNFFMRVNVSMSDLEINKFQSDCKLSATHNWTKLGIKLKVGD